MKKAEYEASRFVFRFFCLPMREMRKWLKAERNILSDLASGQPASAGAGDARPRGADLRYLLENICQKNSFGL